MGLLAKSDRDFFQLLEKAYGDPMAGIPGDPIAGAKVKAAVQAFFVKPKAIMKKKIQALKQIQAVNGFSVSTDFAILTKDAFNVTVEEDNFDMGYEQSFQQVTLGKGQDSWEIYNVENGITFKKIEEGGRVEVYGLEGTKVSADVDYYASALGWTDKMIRFRKVPAMLNNARLFRNKFWANKATNHYALLAAAAATAGQTTAYQGLAADGRLQRDILTINSCAFTLGDDNKDKGYGDAASIPFIIYANPNDEERIEAAFTATTGGMSAGTKANVIATSVTSRRITRIYTYNSNIVSGQPLMVLPKQKIQKADAMQPTTYTQPKDPLTLNELQAVWAIYGAIVADPDQVRRFTLG
jgi:hypothetical protein